MEIIEKSISEIIPYENNPRNNDKAVEPVATSIKEFGFKVPIVIDNNGVIVAGHTRFRAAEKLGMETVPCIVADDLTEEQIKAFRLADNKVAEFSEWDFNLLDEDLMDIYEIDMTEFGFDIIEDDGFGTDFELPDGDKPEICQMTFTLHESQKALIEAALKKIGDNVSETYGNTNKNGNALFEVVRQWEEQKK